MVTVTDPSFWIVVFLTSAVALISLQGFWAIAKHAGNSVSKKLIANKFSNFIS
jgi:hypothetical protein